MKVEQLRSLKRLLIAIHYLNAVSIRTHGGYLSATVHPALNAIKSALITQLLRVAISERSEGEEGEERGMSTKREKENLERAKKDEETGEMLCV